MTKQLSTSTSTSANCVEDCRNHASSSSTTGSSTSSSCLRRKRSCRTSKDTTTSSLVWMLVIYVTTTALLVVLDFRDGDGVLPVVPMRDTTTRMTNIVHAYAPNHPLHPLHPILTKTTTNTNTATTTVMNTNPQTQIPPKHVPNDITFVSQHRQPAQKPTLTMHAASVPSTSSVLATPTVDQLELHQLLQRQRHNTTTNVHMKTTAAATEEDEMHSTVITPGSTTGSSINKKMKLQRKRSGVISATSSSSATSTTKPGKSPSSHKNYVPLLTAAEEMEYSYRIRTLRAALRIREQLVTLQNGIYIHPTEQQWCMACGCTTLKQLRRLIQEGQAAKTQLISSNTGLVIQYAKKQYATLKQAMEAGGGVGTILTLSDMIQEGHFGLIEAAERYQPEKGFRFSTYATYWVKQRILRCISDSSRTIRLPVHVHETLYKIKKAKRTLYGTLGREPTITEIAQSLDISEDRIRSYTASSRNVISLERPLSGTVNGGASRSKSSSTSSSTNGGGNRVSSGSGSNSMTGMTGSGGSGGGGSGKSSGGSLTEDTRTLLDTIASDGPTPEEDAVLDSMRRDIRAVLDTELAGLEQQVVRYRFGLVYDDYDDDLDNREDGDMIRHHRHRLLNNTIKCGESYSVRETSQILQISMDRVRLLEARALNKLRHPMRNYKLKDYVQGLGSTTTSTTSSMSTSSTRTQPNSHMQNLSSSSAVANGTHSSRLRRKVTTSTPTVQPLSPLQQWLSFQHSEYVGLEEEMVDSTNSHNAMTKSRLEEAYANSPSSYTTTTTSSSKSTTSNTSANRLWFF